MRILLLITLLLALLIFGYSFVGEASVWARYSDVRSTLAAWRQSNSQLPADAYRQLDAIVLRMRHEWRVIRGLAVLTSLAALSGLLLASFDRQRNSSASAREVRISP